MHLIFIIVGGGQGKGNMHFIITKETTKMHNNTEGNNSKTFLKTLALFLIIMTYNN